MSVLTVAILFKTFKYDYRSIEEMFVCSPGTNWQLLMLFWLSIIYSAHIFRFENKQKFFCETSFVHISSEMISTEKDWHLMVLFKWPGGKKRQNKLLKLSTPEHLYEIKAPTSVNDL